MTLEPTELERRVGELENVMVYMRRDSLIYTALV
jgi:hypothetical protein